MNEAIAQADATLLALFRDVGYRLSPVPGVIDGVKVGDREGRYLFAWHRHPHHLLFYIRQPALQMRSTLRQSAVFQHGSEAVRQNSGSETLIYLRSDEDARKLRDWLKPKLPL